MQSKPASSGGLPGLFSAASLPLLLFAESAALASRLSAVTDAAEQKARREVRRAQADFERDQKQLREARAKSRAKRRATFERAQKAGLSLREIAAEIGLHPTRVREILRDK